MIGALINCLQSSDGTGTRTIGNDQFRIDVPFAAMLDNKSSCIIKILYSHRNSLKQGSRETYWRTHLRSIHILQTGTIIGRNNYDALFSQKMEIRNIIVCIARTCLKTTSESEQHYRLGSSSNCRIL